MNVRDDTADPSETPQALIDQASRRRAFDAVARCMRLVAIAAGRDYEHCGKVACARLRRCRGFACEPDADDEGGET
jgi:hypothetical protein